MKRIAFSLALLVTLSYSGPAQTLKFFDDFESGTNEWFLQSNWGLFPLYSFSGTYSLTDSPGGDYVNNKTSYATMTNGVDLTGYLSATLTMRSIFSLENGFDFVYVQVSADNFASFVTLASFNGEHSLSSTTNWDEYSFSLAGFLSENNVKVRFKFMSDGGYTSDGFYVDDVKITASSVDNQAPALLYSPPEFFAGTPGPFVINAEIIDISGISAAYVHCSVDGALQSPGIPGNHINGDTFQFTIPAQSPGSFVDYWLTATDNSPLQNIHVSDTFHYISGHYISYDDGVVDFFTSVGPGSTQAAMTACAVRISIPDSAPNLVTALIRNYADMNNSNDSMWIHIWNSDSLGGIGEDLITPFPVSPEANPLNTLAMTRIDLRPWDSLLVNQSGDIFVGFSVPSGKANITVSSPATANRSYIWNGQTWIAASSDYCFRAITGANQHDIAILGLESPVSGAVLDTNETVTIRIKNNGTMPQLNIPVSYGINNEPQVQEIFTDTLAPGELVNYTFSTTANFSLPGIYYLTAQVLLPGDQNPTNNQFTDTIYNYGLTSCDTIHYDGLNHTSIGLTSGGTFNVAVRYPASMMSPLAGASLNQLRIFIKDSPTSCTLKIWGAGSAISPGTLIHSQDVTDQISDSGWNLLNINPPIDITNTDIWVGYEVSHTAGKYPAGVDIGPAHENGGWIQIGTADWSTTIGNWNIHAIICPSDEIVDFGIAGLASPVSGPGLSPMETISVIVKNQGTRSLTGIPLSYSINGGVPVLDTITDTLAPTTTYLHTFSVPANLSAYGDYTIDIVSACQDDQNITNDSLSTTITHYEFTSCDTLHYDGPSTSNIGLSNGGTFRVAARFPVSYITPVMGGHLEQVIINIGDLPSVCKIKIWQGGNSAGPGPEIYSKNVNGLINDSSWNYLQPDSTIILSNSEYWIGYEVSHAAGKKPVGCASGPAHANGNWVSYAPGSWMHNPSYSGLGSWNIRAVICPAVLPLSAIEGNLMYANGSNTPLNNAVVYLKSGDTVISQTVTDSSGHYFMDEIPPGTYSITAISAEPWGGYNSVDALGVLRHFVSINPLTGIHLIAADVSGDGFVNSMDALLIAKRFVGLITNFPKGNWAFEKKFITITNAASVTQNIFGLCYGDVNGSYIP